MFTPGVCRRHHFWRTAGALIWIKSASAVPTQISRMNADPRRLVRHCPVCGIAMQASKSREDLREFDRFECQTCKTTIRCGPQRVSNGRDK